MGIGISAWASALLVLDRLGNAKASMRGTSDRYRLPRFFYICKETISPDSGGLPGKHFKSNLR